ELLADGIAIGVEDLHFPGHLVLSEIGRGANGIVLRCRNVFLDRPEAVKVWLKLRDQDNRNKFVQGLAEARKAASAVGSYVPQVYSAGVLGRNYFYVSMQIVEGPTLKKLLSPARHFIDDITPVPTSTLLARVVFAQAYIHVLDELLDRDLVHGDPHASNIIVASYDLTRRTARLKLLDFGTSCFSSTESLDVRHWRVVHETMSRIFDHHPIFVSKGRPPTNIHGRLRHYSEHIREILEIWDNYGADPIVGRLSKNEI
ncbi:AarF/UbiB family protein, partial [Nostoc sp. CHAB 5715]|uniref:protein kinase domain-containing protein n=1 Tax=Nostoc sp. CHAB 5715 TaxID=2780400 RepID=UPI001E4C0756